MSVDNVEFSIGGEAGVVLPWLPAAVILVSSEGMIAGHTPAAARMLGGRNRSLAGVPLLPFFAPGDDGVVAAFLQRVSRAAPDETIHADARLIRQDGAVRNVELFGANLLADTAVGAIVLHLADVTRHVRIREAANRDALTGLANREAFGASLEAAWRRLAAGSTGPVTVLFCDLDRFKTINDRWGHATGDVILAEVARRLAATIGDRGAIGRFGGDEFVVLLDDDLGWESICEEMLASIQAPITVEGRSISVTVSIGVAQAVSSDGGPGRILREADAAMYAAKSSGRSRWHLFDGTIHDPAALARIASLEGELRRDYLTGVGNARALDEHLQRTHEQARRTASPYVVAFVDGDRFGAINKRYGQDTGDAVVQAIARALAGEVRAGDMVFRRGGDEFIVVLRDTTVQGAKLWLNRVRRACATGFEGNVPAFTVSAGIADFDPEAEDTGPLAVMARADQAMRRAKSSGRNRIVVA